MKLGSADRGVKGDEDGEDKDDDDDVTLLDQVPADFRGEEESGKSGKREIRLILSNNLPPSEAKDKKALPYDRDDIKRS